MKIMTTCFVYLFLLLIATTASAENAAGESSFPANKTGVARTIPHPLENPENPDTYRQLSSVLGPSRMRVDVEKYMEGFHGFSSFAEFESDRYRVQLRKSSIGLGVGFGLLGLGTTVAIIGSIFIYLDMTACDDYSTDPDEESSCLEEQGLISVVAAAIAFPTAALLIIPGIVMTSVYASRRKDAKKVLTILQSRQPAVSLKSFGAFPMVGGAGFGASFTF